MATDFNIFFKNISLLSNTPVMVYNKNSKIMLRYLGNDVKEVPVPQILESSIIDDNKVVGFFSKNGNSVVVYFLRLSIDDADYICILRDEKDRQNLNKFFQANALYFKDIFDRKVSFNPEPAPVEDNSRLLEMEAIVKGKDSEIESLKQLISDNTSELSSLDAKYAEAVFDLGELKSLTEILRKSRDKMRVLIDAVVAPLYSVSSEMVILHANKATAVFAKIDNIADVVGKKCHEILFNSPTPCQWCTVHEVLQTGENTTVEQRLERKGGSRIVDYHTFPLIDGSGTIVDCGCVIADKTDTIEMESSIVKIREQLQTFKKSKISDMNELQDVKKAYAELSVNYTAILGRNVKMTKTIETLMSKDTTKEILAAKTEMHEYKNKLSRSYDAIKNYQRNIENLQIKYSELNKRTFFQMERLINIMNSKYGATEEDVRLALELLARNIEEIKKMGVIKNPTDDNPTAETDKEQKEDKGPNVGF